MYLEAFYIISTNLNLIIKKIKMRNKKMEIYLDEKKKKQKRSFIIDTDEGPRADTSLEALAKLNNYPTGPRKMRLLADVIRGMEVEKAMAILEFHPQHNATPLAKLLKSAINNWEQKNEGSSAADSNLIVKTVFVDGGRVLKRMKPAPQGRGYRIRKRSNHVTIIVDTKTK